MSSPVCCHPHHRVLQDPADRSAGEPGKELRAGGTKPSNTDKETAGEREIKSSGVEFLTLTFVVCRSAPVTPRQHTKG